MKKLQERKYDIHGRLDQALDLLNLYTRENKEDTKEIKLKQRESLMELEKHQSRIREQELNLRKLRTLFQESDDRLKVMSAEFRKVNPKGKKNEE